MTGVSLVCMHPEVSTFDMTSQICYDKPHAATRNILKLTQHPYTSTITLSAPTCASWQRTRCGRRCRWRALANQLLLVQLE